MNLRLLFFIPTFLHCILSYSQTKKVCFTIDDLPTVTYSIKDSKLDLSITQKLISTFKKYDIPAIGYVCEGKLYRNGILDSNKLEVLKQWLENGYDLGNHTYAHFDYNKVTDSIFFNDILKGERIIKPLLREYNKELKYFRHPYLHTGMDSVSAAKLHNFLVSKGYQEAPVTIDNDDYLFAKAYHNAHVNKNDTLKREIGHMYIKYMEEKLIYFESKSIEVFDKIIPQTLLIHASLINADYLDEIAETYLKHGYTFISQEEILNTPEYSTPVTTYFKRGFSWIFRWGLSMGKGNGLMEDDVDTPDKIIQLAKN